MVELKMPQKEVIIKVIKNQPSKTHTVLSSLLAVSNEFHYIPKNSIQLIAEYTKKTVNDVWKFSKNMWSQDPTWYLVETSNK